MTAPSSSTVIYPGTRSRKTCRPGFGQHLRGTYPQTHGKRHLQETRKRPCQLAQMSPERLPELCNLFRSLEPFGFPEIWASAVVPKNRRETWARPSARPRPKTTHQTGLNVRRRHTTEAHNTRNREPPRALRSLREATASFLPIHGTTT